jgi:hypothetical protein
MTTKIRNYDLHNSSNLKELTNKLLNLWGDLNRKNKKRASSKSREDGPFGISQRDFEFVAASVIFSLWHIIECKKDLEEIYKGKYKGFSINDLYEDFINFYLEDPRAGLGRE